MIETIGSSSCTGLVVLAALGLVLALAFTMGVRAGSAKTIEHYEAALYYQELAASYAARAERFEEHSRMLKKDNQDLYAENQNLYAATRSMRGFAKLYTGPPPGSQN